MVFDRSGCDFLRRREGETVALSELWPPVPFFIGRFLRLGLLVGIGGDAIDSYPRVSREPPRSRCNARGATARRIELTTIMVLLDVALTFVTSALVFTTRSARQALRIGLAMIRQTWPRTALPSLSPSALNMLNGIYPTEILLVNVVTTAGLGLLALLAKGAIAAFYLRERSVSADAAAALR